MLDNGNIGVCANLGEKIPKDIIDIKYIDINSSSHRIIISAYFNALLNYQNNYETNKDIFDAIDFKKYNNIVMVGFFKPILQKFDKSGIKVTIFDIHKESNLLTKMHKQNDLLKKADAVILTSTSLSNNTFTSVINSTINGCDIHMLGPSSLMTHEMFGYKNIKTISGATFDKYDNRILDIIKQGYGTKAFLKYGVKRTIYK